MNAHQITVPAVIYAGEGSVEQLRDIIRAERAKTILVFRIRGFEAMASRHALKRFAQRRAR